jgi:hypothetical protein
MIEIPTMPEPPKQGGADRRFLVQDRTETMDAGCRIADTGVSFPDVDAQLWQKVVWLQRRRPAKQFPLHLSLNFN